VERGAAPAVLGVVFEGVIAGAAGDAVELGATESLSRMAGGSGVGGGIRADSKNRTPAAGSGTGAAATGVGAAGVATAGATGADDSSWDGAAAVVTAGCPGGAAAAGCPVPGTPGTMRTFRSFPHDWQLVCPRKINLAPQKRHV
jgi:hypothetical protein